MMAGSAYAPSYALPSYGANGQPQMSFTGATGQGSTSNLTQGYPYGATQDMWGLPQGNGAYEAYQMQIRSGGGMNPFGSAYAGMRV